jgi:hypothetical protein
MDPRIFPGRREGNVMKLVLGIKHNGEIIKIMDLEGLQDGEAIRIMRKVAEEHHDIYLGQEEEEEG